MEKIKSIQPIPEHAKKVFEGIIFDVYQWEQELFDGSKAIFEKAKRIDTAVIIPITKEGKTIILDQEQPGKGRYLSLPGGMIDKGEEPLKAAKRELKEETGFVGNFELIHAAMPINKVDWTIYFFLAKECERICDQDLDCGEKIDVKLVEIEEFLQMLISQEVKASDIVLKFLKDNLLVVDREKSLEKIKNYFLNNNK